MKVNIRKYFWNLNESALKETGAIFKDPWHARFAERMTAFLSRCDKPKELFSLISQEEFVSAWPRIKAYWKKAARASDFRNWWQTVYEQILQEAGAKDVRPTGGPSPPFLKVGRTIKEARINKGLTQKALAIKAGMKQPDISMVEEGKKNITLETLVSLCNALGIKNIQFY